MKDTVRFSHAPLYFVSLYLFVFTFAMKLKDANSKIHWNILWPMKNDVRFEYVQCKSFWLSEFPFFGFTLFVKLRNFDFEKQALKYFNIFW